MTYGTHRPAAGESVPLRRSCSSVTAATTCPAKRERLQGSPLQGPRYRELLCQQYPVAALLTGVLLVTGGCSHEEAGSAAAESDKVVNVAVTKVARADLSQGLRIAAELQDELNQVAASVRQSEQEVDQAQHQLKRAQADYTVAHLTCTRLQGVMKTRPELIAQQDVDDAQGKDEAAEAQVEGAKAGLAAAQEHLHAASANRERVQALFNYTKITAPFEGVVTRRYADTGAMLAAGTTSEQQALPLVKLSQNGLLRLDIPVPEADVPGVRLGKKVSVEVQALSKAFEGTVARFADKVDDATRTMITEVDVSNPQLEIVPGMYAYVSFPVMEKKDVLAVPIQAVSREGNKAIAYRVNNENRVEVRPVTVGIETRSQIEVLSGLSEGDRVVVGNTSQLRQDQIVAPKIVELSEA